MRIALAALLASLALLLVACGGEGKSGAATGKGDDAQRLQRAYWQVLSRPPDDWERERMLEFEV